MVHVFTTNKHYRCLISFLFYLQSYVRGGGGLAGGMNIFL